MTSESEQLSAWLFGPQSEAREAAIFSHVCTQCGKAKLSLPGTCNSCDPEGYPGLSDEAAAFITEYEEKLARWKELV